MAFVLEARDLPLRAGDRELGRVHVQMETGRALWVRGPSGAGKSTLLRALARLDPIPDARLFLHGRSAEELSSPAWRTRVVYLPPTPWLGEGTVREALVRPFRFRHVTVGFDEDATRLQLKTLGLDNFEHRAVHSLSTGQQQRVALVRALSLRPNVLLADEPTAHLDPETKARAQGLVTAMLESGGSIAWVAHDDEPPRLGRELWLPTPENTKEPSP